jgi:hypothetical protein
MNRHLQSLTVGDLLWLPKFGDKSPVWLVVDVGQASFSEEDLRVIALLDLEDCYVQHLASMALNEEMRIL